MSWLAQDNFRDRSFEFLYIFYCRSQMVRCDVESPGKEKPSQLQVSCLNTTAFRTDHEGITFLTEYRKLQL